MNKENEADVRGVSVLARYTAEANTKNAVKAEFTQNELVELRVRKKGTWDTLVRIEVRGLPSEGLAIKMRTLAQDAITELMEGGAA